MSLDLPESMVKRIETESIVIPLLEPTIVQVSYPRIGELADTNASIRVTQVSLLTNDNNTPIWSPVASSGCKADTFSCTLI